VTTKDIEELATNAVRKSIITSGYLSPFIAENDKEPSWDGFVYIYENKKKQKIGFKGRVPVQIKGTINENMAFDTINYSVNTIDLNSYLYDGGVIYFVVYISADGSKERIYYATLSPVRLITLLDTCKDQKSKTISFKHFPLEGDRKSTIFLQFFTDCKKQASFKSSDMLSIDNDEVQKGISTINMSVSGFGYTNEDVQKAFFENEVYIYGKRPNLDLPIPFKVIPERLHTMEEQPCEISVNGTVFYSSFLRIRSKEETKIKIGKSFSLQLTCNSSFTIKFTPAANLKDRIQDCEFLIEVINKKGFHLNQFFLDFNPTAEELGNFQVENMQAELNYLKDVRSVLSLLNIKKDIDIDNLSNRDKREIDNLITAFVKKTPVHCLRKDLLPICKIKIQNITLALVYEKIKDEEGTYYIYDFFKSDLEVHYGNRDSGERLITSQYSLLKPDDYCVIDNIDYNMIVPSYQRLLKENPNIVERANFDMLNMLLAYDKTNNGELLLLIKQMCEWIEKSAGDSLDIEIVLLNSLQIVRRQRELNISEIQLLCNITENPALNEEMKVGAYLLLGNQMAAEIHFKLLTAEKQENFRQFPIYRFWGGE
jgi:hypothetical protein